MRTKCIAERVEEGPTAKRQARELPEDGEREAKKKKKPNPDWERSRKGTRTTITREALARHEATEETLRLCQEDLERARFRMNDLEAAWARRLLFLRKIGRREGKAAPSTRNAERAGE